MMQVGFSVTVTNHIHTCGLEMSEQNMHSSSLILSDINPSCSHCVSNNNNNNTYLFTYLLTYYLLTYLLLCAIELSQGGSSPYISTDKTKNNKIYIKETIQNHSTNNTKHSTYITHIATTPTQLSKPPHITTQAHTHTHTLQNNLK